jgi:addiction module RelE/StbE family toxin
MRLIWDEQARNDLMHIRRYVARDNPTAAARVAATIRARILSLLEHPLMGRDGRTPRTRELVISGLPYIGIYRVDESRATIEILRVMHSAQLYPPDESF